MTGVHGVGLGRKTFLRVLLWYIGHFTPGSRALGIERLYTESFYYILTSLGLFH